MNKVLGYGLLIVAGGLIGAALTIGRGTGTDGGAVSPGRTDAAAAAAPASVAPATSGSLTSSGPVGYADIQGMLGLLAAPQRSALLADPKAFQAFVDSEAGLRSVLAAARASDLEQNANVAFVVQRQAERALAEAYLNVLIRKALGPDFPTEEQLRKFYDDNRKAFATPQRVHLWQIFWPLAADAGDTERQTSAAEAQTVLKELRSGKLTFADAAARYSGHAGSRLAGGYVGLVSVNDLLPEVRTEVLALKDGAISEPVRTSTGIHLVRRGGVVPARELSYEEAGPEVRQLLLREAGAQARMQLINKAREAYPAPYPADELEGWRQKLAAEPPPSTAPVTADTTAGS